MNVNEHYNCYYERDRDKTEKERDALLNYLKSIEVF